MTMADYSEDARGGSEIGIEVHDNNVHLILVAKSNEMAEGVAHDMRRVMHQKDVRIVIEDMTDDRKRISIECFRGGVN